MGLVDSPIVGRRLTEAERDHGLAHSDGDVDFLTGGGEMLARRGRGIAGLFQEKGGALRLIGG
jgi:hypothetical protein